MDRVELADDGASAPDEVVTAADDDPAPSVHVSGTVRDAHDGRAIGGARVWDAEAGEGAAVTTDASGGFALSLPFAGRSAVLQADADGHLPGHVRLLSHRVRAGGAMPGVVLELAPRDSGGSLVGLVRDDRGTPVAGARVAVTRSRPDAFAADLPHTRTLDDGRFELAAVPPGTHALAVTADGLGDYRRVGVLVPVASRTDVGVIVLARYSWSRIHGSVADTRGAPLAGVRVACQVPGRPNAAAVTDAGGRYALERLVAGVRGVRFDTPGGAAFAREVVLAPGADSELDVRVPVGDHFVAGAVELDGAPAAGMEATCELAAAAGVEHAFGYLMWSTRVGPDGRFRIDGLPGGPVVLYLERSRPHEMHELGTVPVDRDGLRFALRARSGFVDVTGTVRSIDGVPLAGATVSPWEPHGDEARAVTRPDGRYRVRVLVSDDATFPLQVGLEGYEPVWQPVARSIAGSDGAMELDFVLAPEGSTGVVECEVTDEGGRPVPNAACVLRGGPSQRSEITRTDSRGVARFENALAGEVRIAVRHDGFAPAEVSGELAGGDALPLRVQLSVRGRHDRVVEVLGDGGVPVAGAEVDVWVRGAFATGGRTDALGRVTLLALPDGTVEISVEHADYPRYEHEHAVDGDRETPLVLRVASGSGQIVGFVVDSTGAALPEVEVLVWSASPVDGARVFAILGTDADGRFALDRVPIGAYVVESWTRAGTRRATTETGAPPIRLVYE